MITDDRVRFKSGSVTREATIIKRIGDDGDAWLVRLDTGSTVVAWTDELTVLPKVTKAIKVAEEVSIKPRRKKGKKKA
jgi:hypothetical protein